MKRFATHNVLSYYTLVTENGEIGSPLKFYALKKSIKGLLERGRVVIGANYAEERNPYNDFVVGRFAFEVIYLGRKAVRRIGVRHNMRSSHKKFVSQPISISFDRRRYA